MKRQYFGRSVYFRGVLSIHANYPDVGEDGAPGDCSLKDLITSAEFVIFAGYKTVGVNLG